MLDAEEKTGLSFQLLASSVDHSSLALFPRGIARGGTGVKIVVAIFPTAGRFGTKERLVVVKASSHSGWELKCRSAVNRQFHSVRTRCSDGVRFLYQPLETGLNYRLKLGPFW